MEQLAFDINEDAWDPARDSDNERLSLLRELDAASVSHPSQLLDPAFRTVGGNPLARRRTELLLGCTFNDFEILVNRINAQSGYDDDDELEELTLGIDELEQMLGRYRLLKRDSDDRTFTALSVDERRRARLLQQRIDRLRLRRYDPIATKRRELTSSLPLMTKRLEQALDDGDHAEATRLRHLLSSARTELATLPL